MIFLSFNFYRTPTFKNSYRRNGSRHRHHLKTGRKRISSTIRIKCNLILSQLYYADGFVMEGHIFFVVTAITLLSLIPKYKTANINAKLLQGSKPSCSKPLITLLNQQISSCFTGKIPWSYNYAILMWIAVEKQCALPVEFFSQYNNLIFAVF